LDNLLSWKKHIEAIILNWMQLPLLWE
jgi:hypothetical protein